MSNKRPTLSEQTRALDRLYKMLVKYIQYMEMLGHKEYNNVIGNYQVSIKRMPKGKP